MLWWSVIPACLPHATTTSSDPVLPGALPMFDDDAPALDCAVGGPAPLLYEALEDAGLQGHHVGYDSETWQAASYRAFLDDRFLLPWFRGVHWDPLRLPCDTGQTGADLDHALGARHPVASALAVAMARLGVSRAQEPIWAPTQDLVALPSELDAVLAPIVVALQAVAHARMAMAEEAPTASRDLVAVGHGGVLIDTASALEMGDDAVQRWLARARGPRSFYGPARALAFAIEDAELAALAGRDDLVGTYPSDLGGIVVAGSGPDAPGDLGHVALYLDLGGDDIYTHPAGANSGRVPASVHIDLGGNDTYGYVPEGVSPIEGLLPPDAGGRYPGDANYGPISLSSTGRQGSGRYGVGMLFDLQGDDTYTSLRMSQGYGHLGVGVLYDGAGDDQYELEAGGQGAGILGIGLLIDLEGTDTYATFANSQGFGGPLGVGFAVDGAGDDTWFADPGRRADGGIPLYATAQVPGDANASLSQGASTGIRAEADGTFISGGFGVLRDRAGHDQYTASLFAQGSGYWQGAGYLLDGGGADQYDALWYVQGGAAHYAIGALTDDGPEGDAFNQILSPINVHLGSGHDFSVGLYINEAGDDVARLAGLAGGASNCQGIGIAVDNGGNDVWDARHPRALGLGNQSTECSDASRTAAPSVGLFLDSGGGDDTYILPMVEGRATPANDSRFGHQQHGADDEFGGAVDGDGSTSLHATGVAP